MGQHRHGLHTGHWHLQMELLPDSLSPGASCDSGSDLSGTVVIAVQGYEGRSSVPHTVLPVLLSSLLRSGVERTTKAEVAENTFSWMEPAQGEG